MIETKRMAISRQLMLSALAGVAAASLLGGCAGTQGSHTKQFRAEAADRMAQMKAATEYDMASQQFLAGDLDKARRSVENSIAMNDKVARSHVLNGRILIEQGNMEPALNAFAKAIEIDGNNAEAHYYKGIVFERFSQYDNALEAYGAALEAEPTNAQYLLASAEMLIDQQRLDEAEEHLNAHRKSFQHTAGVQQTLGHIANLRGDHERASVHFGEAVLLAPDDGALLEDLARAQFSAGRYSEAEASIRRAMRQEGDTPRNDLSMLRARCLVQLNKPVEAREILAGVVATEDGQQDVQAWIDLGNVSVVLNDWFRVRESGRRAVAIAPSMADGYILSALWQRQQNQTAQAISTLQRAMKVDTSDANAAKLAGIWLSELGRSKEAAQAFALASRRDPRDTQARALLDSARRESAVVSVPTGE